MSTMRSSLGLDRFESDIVEHESRGQTKPSDETLRAVLLAMVPENLEEHNSTSSGLTLAPRCVMK